MPKHFSSQSFKSQLYNSGQFGSSLFIFKMKKATFSDCFTSIKMKVLPKALDSPGSFPQSSHKCSSSMVFLIIPIPRRVILKPGQTESLAQPPKGDLICMRGHQCAQLCYPQRLPTFQSCNFPATLTLPVQPMGSCKMR